MRQRGAFARINTQPQRHAHRRCAKAIMKADFFLQQASKQRSEKAADVYRNIKNGKTCIAQRAFFFAFIQRAHHGAGGRLHTAAAQLNQRQPNQQPCYPPESTTARYAPASSQCPKETAFFPRPTRCRRATRQRWWTNTRCRHTRPQCRLPRFYLCPSRLWTASSKRYSIKMPCKPLNENRSHNSM